jgi:hypothetical protein
VDDRPGVVLTRHFFTSLFDFTFLSDDGADSAKRALLGTLAVAIAFGLLLTRIFAAKYGALAAGPLEEYERAVVADHAFLIAIPMWFVAGACGLVGHALFPDETDFRVLMAEPLTRFTVFRAKLAALLLFTALFVAGTHLALLPLAALTMLGAAKAGLLVPVVSAFAFSSLLGGLFAALAIVALHGLLVLLAPRAQLLMFSGAVRSFLIGVLVLSLPLVARLPGTEAAFAEQAWWLVWAPPAWFVGLERWLTGDARYATLAALGVSSTAAVLLASIASYTLLYSRFDRIALQAASFSGRGDGSRSLGRWIGRAPVRHAVARFVSLTVRRSVLHQTLVVGVLSAAGGFVLNSLLSVDGWGAPLDASLRNPLLGTLLWAPMTMVFLAIPAIRIALSVPFDLRSNWIFRMTEDVAGRAEVVAANVRTVIRLAVLLPLAILGPVQWWMLGPSALNVLLVEGAVGWLLVERWMTDWRRIPFTCSYIPGKGFVPHMVVKGFASYLLFSLFTGVALRLSYARLRTAVLFAVVLGGVAAVLSVRRARHARETGLTFEEELPSDVTALRLNVD